MREQFDQFGTYLIGAAGAALSRIDAPTVLLVLAIIATALKILIDLPGAFRAVCRFAHCENRGCGKCGRNDEN